MKSHTRKVLLLAAVVALVLVLAAWYATLPRPAYEYADTLARIVYDAAGGEIQYLFSVPLAVGESSGRAAESAFLRSFVATSSTADPDVTEALVAALLEGGKRGGTPFVPEVSAGRTILTTSSVPPAAVQGSYPSMAVDGYGSMAFVMEPAAD